ncbi:unnamed protein product, partial [Musa banksii]
EVSETGLVQGFTQFVVFLETLVPILLDQDLTLRCFCGLLRPNSCTKAWLHPKMTC